MFDIYHQMANLATLVIPKAVKRASSDWKDITSHTWGWEIDERNLQSMNLTCFHLKRIGNTRNKNKSPVNIRFVAKTSDIISLKTSDLMLKYQKWQHWAKRLLPNLKTSEHVNILCRVIANAIKSNSRTICTQVSQLASADRQSSDHEWTAYSSLRNTRTVNLVFVHCGCHTGK